MPAIQVRWLLWCLLLTSAWAKPYDYRPLGLKFPCHLDLVTAKSYRPNTADYMWPSMAGPKLNLVIHQATAEATFDQELKFSFGENLKPLSVKSPKGWSYARGVGFRAAFVHTKVGRIFIGARTRSKPPLSDAELEKVILAFVRAQNP